MRKCPASTYEIALRRAVRAALAEDVGAGDVTAHAFRDLPARRAVVIAKQEGVLSGIGAVREVFAALGRGAVVRLRHRDGERFRPGDVLAEVTAPAAVLFTGERTALNFVQQLSGIATLTRAFVDAVGPRSRVRIYDTRKTTPLLRTLEKAAVIHGEGRNHRSGLHDMAMLKNNHIDAAGGVKAAVARLERDGFFRRKPRLPLCIEARTLDEAREALANRADIIMLDNIPPPSIPAIVKRLRTDARKLRRRFPQIEASGNVTLDNIKRYRNLPVDRISIGALTHSAPAVDISMRLRGD